MPQPPRALVVLVRGGMDVGAWPVDVGDRLDLGLVDAVARVQLRARRMGCAIRVESADPAVRGLLRLCGVAASVEVRGQPEDREEAHVHEGVVSGDEPA